MLRQQNTVMNAPERFDLVYPLPLESRTMSSGSDDHLTDFMTPSPPPSPSSQDSDTSNESCQSKRSKDVIVTFEEEPSSRRRDQDSGTASASRQSDSSKGDNIHGQEEPSSVRSRIKRHSGSSIESCQSKRSKGDTLLSVPLQRFLRDIEYFLLLHEPWTMSSWPHGHLTDFMKPSPPPRRQRRWSHSYSLRRPSFQAV